jgi:hypothetical protein
VVAIIVMVIIFADKYSSFFAKLNAKILDESLSAFSLPNTLIQIVSEDKIRSMNPDEQFEYFTKIIIKYTALRLQINCPSESITGPGVYLAEDAGEELS